MEGTSGRDRRGIGLAFSVAALGALLLFWTTGLGGVKSFNASPSGYYGLLTAGFRQGHLYVPIAPAPALLALKDPYDPTANAPYRVHDMILWRGHYYLYHGVTPVILFFWPLVAITGRYPSEFLAVAVFCATGLFTATALLAAIRRRYFPAAPPWTLALGAACLAFASPCAELACDPQFYEVPIACAVCLQMLMFGAVYLALRPERPSLGWLAAASLAFGLALGARPDYVLGGLGLLLPCAWLARRLGGGRAWLGALAAAFGPAAICGFALLAYNAARFGSPVEFGMHYQLAGAEFVRQRLLDPAHLPADLRRYLFQPGVWSRYFPFFSPPGSMAYGVVRCLPWSWLSILAVAGAWWSKKPGCRALIGTLAFGSAANLLLLSCFFFSVRRYMADYIPGMLLLGGIGAQAIMARSDLRGAARRVARLAVGATGLFSMLTGLGCLASDWPKPAMLFALARTCDGPAAAWEKLTRSGLGPLQMDLRLPEGKEGTAEPLVETGVAADARDWLQIAYLPGHRAKLGFFHAGLGLLEGPPFPLPADGLLSVTARFGSLYPPFAHPAFRTWSPEEYGRLIRDLRVEANGREVLRAAVGCYPEPPQYLRVGFRGWNGDGVAERFSGRVRAWRRLPLERPPAPPALPAIRAPIELTLVFPADRSIGSEPLLATGTSQLSDLLYCTFVGPRRIRFALDHADGGGPAGPEVALDPLRPHRLRIWLGSLAAPAAASGVPEVLDPANRGVVWLDGAVVLNENAAFTPADPASLRFGINPYASTVIARRFSGAVLAAAPVAPAPALPPLENAGRYGEFKAELEFPNNVSGTAEPLVVTGESGAGDMLYVRYEDRGHVRFGFDHWGQGGELSPPLPLDLSQTHRLEISLGSLYPPGTAGNWGGRLWLRLDGKVIFDEPAVFYPTLRQAIFIGKNPIGGSTCGPEFTGRILRLARPEAPSALPNR